MRKPEWLSKSIYKVRVGGRKKPSSCPASAQSGRREPLRAAQCPGHDRTQQTLTLADSGKPGASSCPMYACTGTR